MRQLVVRQVLDSLLSDRFGQLVVRQVWDSLLSDRFGPGAVGDNEGLV